MQTSFLKGFSNKCHKYPIFLNYNDLINQTFLYEALKNNDYAFDLECGAEGEGLWVCVIGMFVCEGPGG